MHAAPVYGAAYGVPARQRFGGRVAHAPIAAAALASPNPGYVSARAEAVGKEYGVFKKMDDFDEEEQSDLSKMGKWKSLDAARIGMEIEAGKLEDAREGDDHNKAVIAEHKYNSKALKHTYKVLEAFKGDSYKKEGDASKIGLMMRSQDAAASARAYEDALRDEDADEDDLESLRSKAGIDRTEMFAQLLFAQGKDKDAREIFFGVSQQNMPSLREKWESSQQKYREDPSDVNYLKMKIAEAKYYKEQSSGSSWLFQLKGYGLIDALYQADGARRGLEIKELEAQLKEVERRLENPEPEPELVYGGYAAEAYFAAPARAYGNLYGTAPAYSYAAPAYSYAARPYGNLYG